MCSTPMGSALSLRDGETPLKMVKTASPSGDGSGHFSKPHSPEMMEKICQGYIPKNTTKSSDWALRVFQAWRKQQSERSIEEHCPDNLLEVPRADSLDVSFCCGGFP